MPRTKWTISIAAAVVSIVLILLALGFGRTNVRDAADSLASVGSGLLGFLALLVSIYFGARANPSPRTPEGHLAAAAELLRRRVRTQWEQEIVTRRLEHPRPLRLRWVRTGKPAGEQSPVITDGQLLDPHERVPAAGMVRQFRRLSNRQLLILGDPGSGKSTLALLFTVAALEPEDPQDPVPVLLPLAQWRPDQEDLRTWAAQWISDTNPELADAGKYGADAARALVDANRVLLVLDGLDEMPERLRVAAARHLGGIALVNGLSTVVTCRAVEFEELVARAGRLPMAAEVTISPVQVDDAIEFLTGPEPAGSQRWHKVTRVMRAQRSGPLATALSTPLMIALARAVYEPAAKEPAELTRFPSRAAVQEHLLGQFLITAYAGPDEARRPERWLTTLARHLGHRLFSPTLTWWDLPGAVPSAVIVGTVTALIGLVGLVSCAVVQPFPGDNAVLGLALGLGAGIVSGLGAGRSRARWSLPKAGRLRRAGSIAGTTARDALAAVVLATAVTEIASRAAKGAWQDPVEVLTNAVFVAALAGAFSLINTVLSTWRSALPTRPSWNPRQLPARLLSGIATGLAFALPVGLLVGLVAGINSLDSDESIVTSLLLGGGRLALITAIAITVAIGLPIGVGRWLATPLDDQAPVSPRSVLRSDRVTCFAIAIAAGVSVGSGLALVASAAPALIQFAGYGGGPAIGPALFGAFTVFGSVLLGAGSPWTSYTVARSWLALWGLLPWRMLRFLEDAHERGVLRQVGPVYQFRHDLVQRHLAGRPDLRRRVLPRRLAREYAGLNQQARRAVTDRRRSRAATAMACAVLPLAVGTLTVPVVRDEFTFYFDKLRDRQAAELAVQAARLEESVPTDALRLRIAAREIDSDSGAANELGASVETPGTAGEPARFVSGPVVWTGRWALTSGPTQPVRGWDLTAKTPTSVVLSARPGRVELLSPLAFQVTTIDDEQALVGVEDGEAWSIPLPRRTASVNCSASPWCTFSTDADTYVVDLRRPGSAPIRIGSRIVVTPSPTPGWFVFTPEGGVTMAQSLTREAWHPVEIGRATGFMQSTTPGLLSYFDGTRTIIRVLDTGRVVETPARKSSAPLGDDWFALLDQEGSATLYERDGRAKDIPLGDEVSQLVALPDASLAVVHATGAVDWWRGGTGPADPARQSMPSGIAEISVGRNDHVVSARRQDGRTVLVDLTSGSPKTYEIGRLGETAQLTLTKRWAVVVPDVNVATTELWDISATPRRIGYLAGLPVTGNNALPLPGYDLDRSESWLVMQRHSDSAETLDLWHLGTNPKPLPLGTLWRAGPYFSGPFAIRVDAEGLTTVFELPGGASGAVPKIQREYVSGLHISDNGAWGVFEHGAGDGDTPTDIMVTVTPVLPAPAVLRPDAWAVACALVDHKPLSRARWQEIAPKGVPYREICRSKVY